MRKVYRIKWGTSRGRDTYGYTTCSCIDEQGRRTSCNGGGYDLEGTALADSLARDFKDVIVRKLETMDKTPGFAHVNEKGELFMDGAVGASTVLQFMEECGIHFDRTKELYIQE